MLFYRSNNPSSDRKYEYDLPSMPLLHVQVSVRLLRTHVLPVMLRRVSYLQRLLPGVRENHQTREDHPMLSCRLCHR